MTCCQQLPVKSFESKLRLRALFSFAGAALGKWLRDLGGGPAGPASRFWFCDDPAVRYGWPTKARTRNLRANPFVSPKMKLSSSNEGEMLALSLNRHFETPRLLISSVWSYA